MSEYRRSQANRSNGAWTAEKVAELRRLDALNLSPPEMALSLGMTKAAGNAKRDRLGLSRPRERNMPPRPVFVAVIPTTKLRKVIIEAVPDTAVPYADWTPDKHSCGWIIGDPGPLAVVCCRPVSELGRRKRWCEFHASTGLGKPASPEERERAARSFASTGRRWA